MSTVSPASIASFRYEMDGMKHHQKLSAGYRDTEHLSVLCAEL